MTQFQNTFPMVQQIPDSSKITGEPEIGQHALEICSNVRLPTMRKLTCAAPEEVMCTLTSGQLGSFDGIRRHHCQHDVV
jgi:hypothetical protein